MEKVVIIKKAHGMQSYEEEADKKGRGEGIVQKSTLPFCASNTSISQKPLFSWRKTSSIKI